MKQIYLVCKIYEIGKLSMCFEAQQVTTLYTGVAKIIWEMRACHSVNVIFSVPVPAMQAMAQFVILKLKFKHKLC